jgi:hypothetical protein
MNTGIKPWMAAGIVAIAVGVVYVVTTGYGSSRTMVGDTLDPNGFEGLARDAYTVAREHPKVLAQLHCYCGCANFAGHKNLLDCFRTTHASVCPVCMHEALDADGMLKQHKTIPQMRDTLQVMYGQKS